MLSRKAWGRERERGENVRQRRNNTERGIQWSELPSHKFLRVSYHTNGPDPVISTTVLGYSFPGRGCQGREGNRDRLK